MVETRPPPQGPIGNAHMVDGFGQFLAAASFNHVVRERGKGRGQSEGEKEEQEEVEAGVLDDDTHQRDP